MKIIETSRTIYVAISQFAPELVETTHAQLLSFQRFFEEKQPLSALDEIFSGEALEFARRAARLVHQFQERAGEYTGAVVHRGYSSPTAKIEGDCSLSIENHDAKLFGPEFSELACEIALVLEAMLRSLGASRTISGYID